MLSIDLLLVVCLGYVALLFALAFYVDRRARQGRLNWLRSPVVYTLSISVYCTSWTFYGAVGSAARNGLEFITIYLGPTLVFVGWWWLLRKLVRICRTHRITSIADLISSRYGKSSSLAVLVTVIAVIATTPYIALQLQSVTRSYQVIVGDADSATTAFWVAAGMALFTILFGTRNLDANERHHGVVAAIAVEAIVKLVALIAVGIFVVYGGADGLGDIFADVPSEVIYGGGDIFGARRILDQTHNDPCDSRVLFIENGFEVECDRFRRQGKCPFAICVHITCNDADARNVTGFFHVPDRSQGPR